MKISTNHENFLNGDCEIGDYTIIHSSQYCK